MPHHAQWEQDGIVPRELWLKAGEAGLLCFDVPEEYGGPGIDDFRFNVVLSDEQTRAGASGPGFSVHSDIIVPYLSSLGTEEQKQRWLPGCVSGETITAIAMTEPGAGSDLQGVRTTAVDAGDHYVAQRVQDVHQQRHQRRPRRSSWRGPTPTPATRASACWWSSAGWRASSAGRNLDKIGLHAQDTAELSFTDVRVPKENLLGEEGQGFLYLMQNLPQERLIIGAQAVAAIEAVVEMCVDYAKTREAFGRPIGKFQHNRFLVAEMATEARVARAFLDDCVRPAPRRRADRRRRRDDQVVGHRAPEQDRQPGRAAARRLRLHDRVPDREGLPRQPGLHHLRRDHRDPEGDHRT